jgi:hypothetical protein
VSEHRLEFTIKFFSKFIEEEAGKRIVQTASDGTPVEIIMAPIPSR